MLAWLCMVAGALVSACTPAAANDDRAATAAEPPPAVVKTVTLKPATLSQRRDGTANILAPGDLVDLDAELRNAAIAVDFARVQFERFKTTPTLPRLTVENSERQLKTDSTSLERLKSRLAHTWGEAAPMIDDAARKDIVQALTTGAKALARLDFPGGLDGAPKNVEVKPLGGTSAVKVESLWQAPSGNQAMPGVSFFALIPQSDGLRPGDRATASAETAALDGIVIPNASIIVTESTSWCYVEKEPGEFERKPVSLTTPTAEGYLVREGFEPGMKVVISGASTLLAREADPAAGGDDDDDGGARPVAKARPAVQKEAAKDDDDAPKAPAAAAVPAHAAAAAAAAERDDDVATGATGASPVDRN